MDTTRISTPVGELSLAVHDNGAVAAAGFCPIADLETRLGTRTRERHDLGAVSAAVRAYLLGDLGAIDGLAVEQPGTPGRQRVWQALREIPAGTTLTYGELTGRLGLTPGNARAVGSACGANLVAPIVPCHRVVRAGATPLSRRVGGYYYGLSVKEWLLGHEGAVPAILAPPSTMSPAASGS